MHSKDNANDHNSPATTQCKRRLSTISLQLLHMNNLRNRHVIVVDKCCMCKRNGESVDLFLLHCDVAYAIWIVFFNRFGLS